MYAFGMYVDGKREGLHVVRNKSGYEFTVFTLYLF